MGVPDALGGRTLGLPRMGFAVPFGSGPFRALLPGARQTPQEDNRVGLADAPATQALAASPPDHRRGRWRVCFPKAPRPMPASQEPYYLHHPPQDRRRSVRTGPASQAAPDGKTSPEGSSPSEPLGGARRPTDNLEDHHGERLVRWRRTRGGDRLRDGYLALYGLARRARALGAHPRSPGGIRSPGFAVHRSRSRSVPHHFVVRAALADGDHFPGSSPAPGIRDPETLVGDGDQAGCPGAFGSVLPGCALRSPAEAANAGDRAAGSVVRQGAPDLLRCSGVGEKGAVGTTRGDFSRVGAGDRGSKSPAQVHRKADRRGLLCSVMAKVQLRQAPFRSVPLKNDPTTKALVRSAPARVALPKPQTLRSASLRLAAVISMPL